MEINSYLIRFSCMLMLMFGGLFVIQYVKTGDLYLDQLLAFGAGFVLFIGSLIWKTKHQQQGNRKAC
ncbi:hypothetical protein ABFY59_11010 [Priestia aryabhattai]|uniref:hypothetical protein n=1 Tax=Priestia aryabhattai TaxID=412384 RepID=UPI001C0C9F04|nr:hypothetical protein [Priestia aryabhattai]MBU3573602.1 hypothetical protein [Priestia aryabhattai]WDL86570.1 hypothetical protein IUJ58_21900 [Priestia aryabhattai]